MHSQMHVLLTQLHFLRSLQVVVSGYFYECTNDVFDGCVHFTGQT